MIWYIIAFTAVVYVLMTVAVENEYGFAATICLIGYLAVLQLFFGVDVLGFVKTFPIHLACAAIVYVLCGLGWSIFKWYWYVTKEVDKLKERYPKDYETKTKTWLEALERYVPKPNSEKTRIIGWMGYWPLSLVWFLVDDIVKEIFNWLYYRFAAIYQKITDAAIRRVS